MIANTSEEVRRGRRRPPQGTLRNVAARGIVLARTGQKARRRGHAECRIINTSSGAGLQGSVGQGNYSAAKAGIAALTLVSAAEMGRYGVTVNAIAPAARTRMTETVFADMMARPRTVRRDGAGERLATGGVAGQRRIP